MLFGHVLLLLFAVLASALQVHGAYEHGHVVILLEVATSVVVRGHHFEVLHLLDGLRVLVLWQRKDLLRVEMVGFVSRGDCFLEGPLLYSSNICQLALSIQYLPLNDVVFIDAERNGRRVPGYLEVCNRQTREVGGSLGQHAALVHFRSLLDLDSVPPCVGDLLEHHRLLAARYSIRRDDRGAPGMLALRLWLVVQAHHLDLMVSLLVGEPARLLG